MFIVSSSNSLPGSPLSSMMIARKSAFERTALLPRNRPYNRNRTRTRPRPRRLFDRGRTQPVRSIDCVLSGHKTLLAATIKDRGRARLGLAEKDSDLENQ